jgi:hypothetical protein
MSLGAEAKWKNTPTIPLSLESYHLQYLFQGHAQRKPGRAARADQILTSLEERAAAAANDSEVNSGMTVTV